MNNISPDKKCKLLSKLLLFWDGQWFLKVKDILGINEAIEINKKVRKSFARIEMREALKLLNDQDIPLSYEESLNLLKQDFLCSTFEKRLMKPEITLEHGTLPEINFSRIVRRLSWNYRKETWLLF